MFSIQHRLFLQWSLMVVWHFVLLMTETSGLKPEEKHPSQSIVPDDARLARGDSLCSGRLEMKHQGEWRALIPKYSDPMVTYRYAQVVCGQIGCGSVVSTAYSTNDTNQQPGWEARFICKGTESTLKECDSRVTRRRFREQQTSAYSLDVICSESIRLVGASHLCTGRVEVKSHQGWVSVCNNGFNYYAEKVVCREMDCGPPVYFLGSEGGRSVLTKQFQCAGSESRLEDCASSFSNNCESAAGISCSGYNLRLVGGENLCKGTLEGKLNGEWRPLSDKWRVLSMQHFGEICRTVGCADYISYSYNYRAKPQPVWELSSRCIGDVSPFCKRWEDSDSASVIAVTCSEAVRLVNGPNQNRCSGKLEVKADLWWFTVCESLFSPEAALLTCRDLECGFPEEYRGRKDGSHFSMGTVFKCEGKEKHLMECPHTTLNVTEEKVNCNNTYLTCTERPHEPEVSVHIQGYVSDPPKVFKGHHFAISCKPNSLYKIHSIRLKSGVDTKYKTEQIQSPVDREAVFMFPAAENAHQGNYQCDYTLDVSSDVFSQPKTIFITIQEQNDVWLVGRNSRCAGRLEVEHLAERRPVSYMNSWSLKEAAVVCRQLNCGSSVSTTKANNSSELLPAWRFYSDCDGSEQALMDCGTVKKWMSSSTTEVVCSDILLQPRISVSSMGELSNEQQQQDVRIFKHHSFTISCSVEPQYPAGHFSIIFTGLNQTHSHTQAAVNHTAYFTYTATDKTFQGDYRCVYHNLVFSHNFSSESQSLSVTVLEKDDIMLDDGVSEDDSMPCAGKLWVNHGEELRMLSAETTVWGLKHASVVCRQLGCGSAVSTKEIHLPKKERVFRFFSDCDGSESALLDCGTVKLWFSSSAVEVVCTGVSEQGGPTPPL